MPQLNFNAANVDPSTGGSDVFENGDFTFVNVGSEMKATKSGTGTMLVFDAKCIGPEGDPHVGKRLAVRLNVVNSSAQAQDIALRDLSAMCHVCGRLVINASEELHGIPYMMRVEKAPRSDDPSKFNNNIKGFMDAQGNAPTAGQPAGTAGPGAAPAAPPAPPAAPAAPAPQPAPQPAPAAQPPAQFAQPPAAQPPAAQPPAGQPPAQFAQPPAAAPVQHQPAPAAPNPAAQPPAAAPGAAAPWQAAPAGAPAAAGAPPPWATS